MAKKKPTGLDIAERPRDELEQDIERLTAERDGWKEIADACIATAFGYDMRGATGSVPPVELIEAVRGRGDTDVIDALRDGILGRAWHVASDDPDDNVGSMCDYPLCPHRSMDASERSKIGIRTIPLLAEGSTLPAARLKTCSIVDANRASDGSGAGECAQWGAWVAARFKAGRIQVRGAR